jgi:hypothetical protein
MPKRGHAVTADAITASIWLASCTSSLDTPFYYYDTAVDRTTLTAVATCMTRRLALLALLATTTTAAAQPSALSWGADEPTHAILLRKGLAGKSLGAVEAILSAEGFHVVATKLVMSRTSVPTLRQGTLSIGYETTVQQRSCPPGAPCPHFPPARVNIELACDQYVGASSTTPDSCDGLRGLAITPQS